MSNEMRKLSQSARCLDEIDVGVPADIADRRHLAAVRYERVDLAEMRDADRSRALEFHRIRDEDHMPGVSDDRLRDLDLAKVEVEQSAVMVDRGSADHRIIDLELLDEIDGRLADDAAVGPTHHAAGDHHFDRGINPH